MSFALISIGLIFLILGSILFYMLSNQIQQTASPMEGGSSPRQKLENNGPGAFQNLCFTEKPRGFYFPSCNNWRPRILFRNFQHRQSRAENGPTHYPKDNLRMSPDRVRPNGVDPGLIRYYPGRWTGAQLGELTLDCDGCPRKPDFLNYEPAYYANSSAYCQANPKQRLCPNHWY